MPRTIGVDGGVAGLVVLVLVLGVLLVSLAALRTVCTTVMGVTKLLVAGVDCCCCGKLLCLAAVFSSLREDS